MTQVSGNQVSGNQISRGTVVIAQDRCKGCELCVPVCPPGVLSMSKTVNAIGYRYPELTPGCTGCTACQMVCPDFVFEIYKFDKPVIYSSEPAQSPNDGRG